MALISKKLAFFLLSVALLSTVCFKSQYANSENWAGGGNGGTVGSDD